MSAEPMYKAIVWYKVGRNRQRWFEVGVGRREWVEVVLAEEVSRWERKPRVSVVGTLQEVGS